MPFQKNHEYRWKPERDESLDTSPICFKGYKGQKERLKSIPNWQERLRAFVAQLILEDE